MKKLQEEAYNKRKSPARLPGLTTNLTTKYVTTDNFDRHSAICDRSQRRKKKKQISVKIHRKKEEDRLFSSRSSWWGKVDSNHRRHCQQIYSLSPLATREFPHIQKRRVELVDGLEPPTC